MMILIKCDEGDVQISPPKKKFGEAVSEVYKEVKEFVEKKELDKSVKEQVNSDVDNLIENYEKKKY